MSHHQDTGSGHGGICPADLGGGSILTTQIWLYWFCLLWKELAEGVTKKGLQPLKLHLDQVANHPCVQVYVQQEYMNPASPSPSISKNSRTRADAALVTSLVPRGWEVSVWGSISKKKLKPRGCKLIQLATLSHHTFDRGGTAIQPVKMLERGGRSLDFPAELDESCSRPHWVTQDWGVLYTVVTWSSQSKASSKL